MKGLGTTVRLALSPHGEWFTGAELPLLPVPTDAAVRLLAWSTQKRGRGGDDRWAVNIDGGRGAAQESDDERE